MFVQVHAEILQNLQQVSFVIQSPSNADCRIREREILIEDKESSSQWKIDFDGLLIDPQKGEEIFPRPDEEKPAWKRENHVCRSFKFRFVQLPKIYQSQENDLRQISCRICENDLKIFRDDEPFRIVDREKFNVDDLNEVVFCHRYCTAHQHRPIPEYKPTQGFDPHRERIALETTGNFIVSLEHFLQPAVVCCPNCSAQFGSISKKFFFRSFTLKSKLRLNVSENGTLGIVQSASTEGETKKAKLKAAH